MRSLKYITRHTMSLESIPSRNLPIFKFNYVRLLITNFEKGKSFQINRRTRFKTSINTKHENGNIKTDCYVIPYDIFVSVNAASLKSKKRRNRTNLIELGRRKKVVNLSKRANNTFW